MASRIMKSDFDSVVGFIKGELERREKSTFRKQHETVWRELDRQIAMKPPVAKNKSGRKDEDWHSAVQLGELADASEILAADVMRLAFPTDRKWFASHIELGDVESGEQRKQDELLRNLMVQQHFDFGLRDRVKLSVKEALHHGGFVAEVEWQTMAKFHDGSKVETLGASPWIPHSMWNCFPDSSQNIIGTDLFYRGSMIIKKKVSQESFRKGNYKNKKKVLGQLREGDDVELICYYGNLYLDRKKRDGLFLPNRKTIIAGEELVFSEINPTPYSPIIYTGYERDDVRDPYYTSPIVKRSPMQLMATHMANKFADGVSLHTEPPIAYNNLDSRYAGRDGPDISPGAKFPTIGDAAIKEIRVGDPTWAREGMIMAVQSVREGTGVDSVRKGVTAGTEQTATEVVKSDQKSEIRVVDFVGTLERQGLSAYLYMQNDLNRMNLGNYPFYNNEIHTRDFIRYNKSNIPRSVRFEITGSRQLLGEEQRTARFMNATAFVASSPVLSQKMDIDEHLRQIYEDTGVKDPERFIKLGELQDPQVQQLSEQLEAMQAEATQRIGELEQSIQENTVKIAEMTIGNAEKDAVISARNQEIRLLKAEKRSLDEIEREREKVLNEKAANEKMITDARQELTLKLAEQEEGRAEKE